MRSIYEFVDPIKFMRVRKMEMHLSFQDMAERTGIKAKSFFHKLLNRSKVFTMGRVVSFGLMLNIRGKRQLEYFEIMTFLYRAKAAPVIREKVLNKFRPQRFK